MRLHHDNPHYQHALDAVLAIGTSAMTLTAAVRVQQSLEARGLSTDEAAHVLNAVLAEVIADQLHITAAVDVDLCTAHMVAIRHEGQRFYLPISTVVLIVGSAVAQHNKETADAHTFH